MYYLYENGPPVMFTGMLDTLSVSALNTSDCPVLYSTPDTGCLSTRTGSRVGSNTSFLGLRLTGLCRGRN
jgi:hypothetical protein